MTYIIFDDGDCFICRRHSSFKCNQCGRFACLNHSREFEIGVGNRIRVCNICYKKSKKTRKIGPWGIDVMKVRQFF